MSNHVNSLLFTPFAGLLNLGKRLGVPETVLAPALRGAGVPDTVDCSKLIEEMTREAVKPLRAHLTSADLKKRQRARVAKRRMLQKRRAVR